MSIYLSNPSSAPDPAHLSGPDVPPVSLSFASPSDGDLDAIEKLQSAVFGPGRFVRTAHRIRERSAEAKDLGRVARDGARIVGSIAYSHITIGDHAALLLGPLAVARDWAGKGVGLRLMGDTLAQASKTGSRIVLLVGDLPYYARAGFEQVPPGSIDLGGPADPARILWRALHSDALDGVSGVVRPVRERA
ncbi:MAG: N-acetyltransferase [Pseudomonadota bacterium]